MHEARSKVSANIWRSIHDDVIKAFYKNKKTVNLFAIDGSQTIIPHSKNTKFNKKKMEYFPRAHISLLYDIDYRIPIHATLSEKIEDRQAVVHHLPYLKAGDIVFFDRGYYSQTLVRMLQDKGVHPVFRMKTNYFKKQWECEENDVVVNYKLGRRNFDW